MANRPTKRVIQYQYEVPARVTQSVVITVLATTPEEALTKVREFDWHEQFVLKTIDVQPTGGMPVRS